MKVLALPRDPNPYQGLLGDSLKDQGVEVCYLEGPTPSQSLNLLLRPLLLVGHRLRGAHVLHIHWVYDFAPAWLHHFVPARRAAQWWFHINLVVARALGFALVWTAHNVLPHERTFSDDLAARKTLAAAAHVVLVHAQSTKGAVERLGAGAVIVVPQGYNTDPDVEALTRTQARELLDVDVDVGQRVVVNVGVMRPYKGIAELIEQAATAGDGFCFLIGGHCEDGPYRDLLEDLAKAGGRNLRLHLERLSGQEFFAYLAAADVGVFPFREVTNSGSVLSALSMSLPVIIPDIPELADIPAAAALRYPPGAHGLREALGALRRLSDEDLDAMSAAAGAFGRRWGWSDAATATTHAYQVAIRNARLHPRAARLPLGSTG